MGKIRQFLVGARKNSLTIIGLWIGLKALDLGVEVLACVPIMLHGVIPRLLAHFVVTVVMWVIILIAGYVMELRRVVE